MTAKEEFEKLAKMRLRNENNEVIMLDIATEDVFAFVDGDRTHIYIANKEYRDKALFHDQLVRDVKRYFELDENKFHHSVDVNEYMALHSKLKKVGTL